MRHVLPVAHADPSVVASTRTRGMKVGGEEVNLVDGVTCKDTQKNLKEETKHSISFNRKVLIVFHYLSQISLDVCERTSWWVPSDCVEVAPTVVEHEFVLWSGNLPLQQRHEVVAIQVPVTVRADSRVFDMGLSAALTRFEAKLKTLFFLLLLLFVLIRKTSNTAVLFAWLIFPTAASPTQKCNFSFWNRQALKNMAFKLVKYGPILYFPF